MNLAERDKKHLWHPITQHKTVEEHFPIKKAQGVYLIDEKGTEYIDAISSWYTCVYGHCNPYIIEKVTQQMQTLDQIVFAGFTHEPAIEMSEKLMEILPKNQSKIFFSDNGSTTIDIAIKMSMQYYFNQGKKRLKIIAFENAFHGDTFGAMSISDLDVYNGSFSDVMLQVDRIPVPNKDNLDLVISSFKEKVAKEEACCFVFEPLVQGANCMQMYDAVYLDELISIANRYDVITIADEVMTGFGKTGKYFACDYLKNQPDIMCLSKALTAGLIPMGLTTCSDKIFDAFYSDEIAKGFFHGHTYSANPLACSAVIAGIELLQSEKIQIQIKSIENSHFEFSQKIAKLSNVKEVRYKGVILAIDIDITIDRYGEERNKIFNYFMSKGVYIRPLGSTIYIVPPYVVNKNQLKQVYNVIYSFLSF